MQCTQRWLCALGVAILAPGCAGADGAAGDVGPQGPDGATGPSPSDAGPNGTQGPQGDRGPDGRDGPPGDAGANGQNGVCAGGPLTITGITGVDHALFPNEATTFTVATSGAQGEVHCSVDGLLDALYSDVAVVLDAPTPAAAPQAFDFRVPYEGDVHLNVLADDGCEATARAVDFQVRAARLDLVNLFTKQGAIQIAPAGTQDFVSRQSYSEVSPESACRAFFLLDKTEQEFDVFDVNSGLIIANTGAFTVAPGDESILVVHNVGDGKPGTTLLATDYHPGNPVGEGGLRFYLEVANLVPDFGPVHVETNDASPVLVADNLGYGQLSARAGALLDVVPGDGVFSTEDMTLTVGGHTYLARIALEIDTAFFGDTPVVSPGMVVVVIIYRDADGLLRLMGHSGAPGASGGSAPVDIATMTPGQIIEITP